MFGALMVAENVAFYLIAAVMVGAALRVVTTKDIVHAALYLVLVLSGVAALYILLAAEFIAITQVLVYIGAIVVLFLFGIMLTRAPGGHLEDSRNEQRIVGGVIAVLLAGVMGFVLIKAFRDQLFDFSGPNVVQTTSQVADSVFSTYLVPFEAISVLLLAALIGAVVLARRD
ncbi:MAG: NADH-quinone oxidoreductase subunit J family protein [Acidimicrobiales bacterium]